MQRPRGKLSRYNTQRAKGQSLGSVCSESREKLQLAQAYRLRLEVGCVSRGGGTGEPSAGPGGLC